MSKRSRSSDFTELQRYALCLSQALLGVISNNLRCVTLTRSTDRIVVCIVLLTPCDQDMEEIEDLKTELEALAPGPTAFDIEVIISGEPIVLEVPSQSHLTVFRRRE